ncbi:MAG: hypothetical protein NTZ64_18865 [Polaromonas sp.]|nr:hypothetical protein [Polaromonas sp.]
MNQISLVSSPPDTNCRQDLAVPAAAQGVGVHLRRPLALSALFASCSSSRSRRLFSLSHLSALIFTTVLIAPTVSTAATAQYSSTGTCTAAIFLPDFGLVIFAYVLLASALMHFVLLPLQRVIVAWFSKVPA